MTTALPKATQARPDDVETRIEALTAVVFATLDRLGRVEEVLAVLAERAGLTAPPVVASEWRTIKATAHDLKCSPSHVHKLIRVGRLIAEKHGGRVLVRADTIPACVNK
jgi:hypothetical protein